MRQLIDKPDEIRLLLCGDVMLGRGIDQLLPHPGDPTLYEYWRDVTSAKAFVDCAQHKNGGIPATRGIDYVWGDVLAAFDDFAPDVRLVNLETAITARGQPWPEKLVHYRMHPLNIDVLVRAGIDFCSLANNHVLDWGYDGLDDTIGTLARAGINHAGAGRNRYQAAEPAILQVPGKGRVIIVSLATTTSGTPPAWTADEAKAGVNLIDLSDQGFDQVRRCIAGVRKTGDIVVASIHWGSNYGHGISTSQQHFARGLIDDGQVDLIYGHSSHHVRGIELHRGKPILYGCGDLINDYEGIQKSPEQELYSPELGLIYLARFDRATCQFVGLHMQPTRMHRMRVQSADSNDTARLCEILNREGARRGTRVVIEDKMLNLDISACPTQQKRQFFSWSRFWRTLPLSTPSFLRHAIRRVQRRLRRH